MEISKSVVFEIKNEDRTYRFEVPEGAPLGEAYQAGWEFLEKIGSLINEHIEKNKLAEPQEPVEFKIKTEEEVKDDSLQESVKDI